MVDFIKFGQGIVQNLTGKLGGNLNVKYSIKAKELEGLALENHAIYDFLSDQGLIGQKGLVLDIITQAKNNYSIASINIRNSSSSLISGFYSVSKGNIDKVEKYHFSDKKRVYTGYKDLKSAIDRSAKNTTIPYTADDLIMQLKKGHNVIDLSRIYKKAASTLNLLLPKQYKHNVRLTPEEIKTIKLMGDNGANASEIATTLELDVSTVRKYMPKEQKQGNILSQQVHDKINELSRQGRTIDEISKACDVSLSSVRRHIENKEAIPQKNEVIVTDDMKKQIIEMYSQGIPKTIIGKKLGIGRMTVDRHIPEDMKKSKEFPQEKIDQINKLGAQGLSAREIARQMGIACSTVNKYILPEYKKDIKTPQEIIDKIKLLFSQGMSTKDIAKECGVGENIVYKYRKTKEIDTTSEFYKKVNSMRKAGKSVEDIASECGVSRATVYNYLEPELKQGDEITDEIKAEIYKMRKAGAGASEIAEKFGISKASVYNHMDNELKNGWMISDELHEKINTLRKSGLTTRQIAKECNISCSSVLNHLAEDIKPKQRANLISKEELINSLSKGERIHDIAEKHGVNESTVWQTMKRFKIRSETSVRGKYRETNTRKYEQFNNEELKERFLNVTDSLYDSKKVDESSDLGNVFDNITNELLSNHINMETREKFIKLIRTLDLAERNILSSDGLAKCDELTELQKWANKAKKLEGLQNRLNYVINNLLPQNKEFELAEAFSKYNITSLDDPNIEILDKYIVRIAEAEDITKECAKILRAETYKNAAPEIKLLADKYSISVLGKIEPDTAGRYIRNLMVLDNPKMKMTYPENFVKIMQKSNLPKPLCARYLTTLDEWFENADLERATLKDFCKKFDINENLGNKIIEEYLFKTYAKIDTKVMTKGDNGIEMESIFAPGAKDGVIGQFKFPNCIKWIADFEDAMTAFIPPDAHRSGIKYMKNRGEYEVKLSDESNRLLSSDKTLRFDIYRREGLHTKKKNRY